MSKTNVTRVCESSSSNLVFRCFFVDESNVSFLHLCSFRAAEHNKGFPSVHFDNINNMFSTHRLSAAAQLGLCD